MIVTGQVDQEVSLSTDTMQKVTKTYIRAALELPENVQVNKDGMLEQWWFEGGGSHSWEETKVLRKATDLDKAAILLLKLL